jgi:MFS family permease
MLKSATIKNFGLQNLLIKPPLLIPFRLNLMFTIAAVGTNVCALPVGTILDRYGPRVSGIIGSILIAAGCLLLAFAWDMKGNFDAYITGYLLLALGGPFVFISSFQLSNTFPKYSGLILALLTGAFDTSSAVFLIYRLVYEASNGSFWPKKFFLVYLIVPAFILVVQLFIMPSQSYKTVGEMLPPASNVDDGEIAPSNNIAPETAALLPKDRPKAETPAHIRSGVYGAMHGMLILCIQQYLY